MRSLVVCTTCKFSAEAKFAPDGKTGGETLLACLEGVLREAGREDVALIPHACLWNCTRPCSVVIRDNERFSYVTGGNAPTLEQAQAIISWFDLHGQTDGGEVPFKQWPQAMRGHFIARMPAVKP